MSVVDEIKQRLDIVEFIGSYVPLQKAGRNYKGLCPFHSEKTPSFIVFPENQGWHCFGACSTGGDIFSFVMRRENMDFPEALRFLAERAGVDLRPLDDVEIEQRNELERLRAANAAAADYYHRVLMESPQGEGARRYLERRGVTRETMAAFQLGYALPAWHALEETLTREKIARDDLLTAGLLSENESGNIYDRFR
ncbi:MAG TPA: DNA primase, partial [Chloroflexi bacterium]|nr:DNA primase [Chloroflexota bacterium]